MRQDSMETHQSRGAEQGRLQARSTFWMLEVLHTPQSSFPSACTSPGTVQLWLVGPLAMWLTAEDTSSPSARKDGHCSRGFGGLQPHCPSDSASPPHSWAAPSNRGTSKGIYTLFKVLYCTMLRSLALSLSDREMSEKIQQCLLAVKEKC